MHIYKYKYCVYIYVYILCIHVYIYHRWSGEGLKLEVEIQYTERLYSVSSDVNRFEWEYLAIICVPEYFGEIPNSKRQSDLKYLAESARFAAPSNAVSPLHSTRGMLYQYQCVAACCSVLQCVAVLYLYFLCAESFGFVCLLHVVMELCNTLQHTATYCNILHHTAIYCSSLHFQPRGIATHCRGKQLKYVETRCNLLQQYTEFQTSWSTATSCNTLQQAATHCNTLQQAATHCNKLQHTTARCRYGIWDLVDYCNIRQHAATHCNTMHGCFVSSYL